MARGVRVRARADALQRRRRSIVLRVRTRPLAKPTECTEQVRPVCQVLGAVHAQGDQAVGRHVRVQLRVSQLLPREDLERGLVGLASARHDTTRNSAGHGADAARGRQHAVDGNERLGIVIGATESFGRDVDRDRRRSAAQIDQDEQRRSIISTPPESERRLLLRLQRLHAQSTKPVVR